MSGWRFGFTYFRFESKYALNRSRQSVVVLCATTYITYVSASYIKKTGSHNIGYTVLLKTLSSEM